MTKELINTLSTGDRVANSKTGEKAMVGVLTIPASGMVGIEALEPADDWELTKSRLVFTDAERRSLEAYHKELKEREIKAMK